MKKVLSAFLVLVILFAFPSITTAAVDSPEIPTPPPEVKEIIEDMQTIYRQTIYYIYPDGTTAAPTYTAQLNAGTGYNVASPEISGYTPTMIIVSGIMPARDMQYMVIYIPASLNPGSSESFLTIEDFETPLGLGASFMHVGISIE